MESLETLFRSSNLQDLDLTGVRLHIHSTSKSKQQPTNNGTLTSNNSKIKESTLERTALPPTLPTKLKKKSSILRIGGLGLPVCPSLSFLRLGGMTVELSKTQVWRSLDILSHLIIPRIDKSKLTHLDISLDKNETSFVLEEKVVLKTLKLVAMNFPKLQTLVIQHWRVRLTNEKSACKEITKILASMECLSQVNCNHSIVTAETGGRRLDATFASCFISALRNLQEFSWSHFDSGVGQILQLGKSVTDNGPRCSQLTLKLDAVPLSILKTLVMVIETKSALSVQYIGNSSITIQQKAKEKSEHLMYKLKRFL